MITTNAMRLLTKARIAFQTAEYAYDEQDLSGLHAAEAIGLQPRQVFKTLVARGDGREILVFCVPVSGELDLKKAAKVSGHKKVEMVAVKELLPLTGYLRGGCSPVGMKKRYPTYLDESARQFARIAVSAGRRGQQMILAPQDLAAYCRMDFAEIT